MEQVFFAGHTFEGYCIPTANSVILIIKAEHGFLGCGYVSTATADKTGDAAAIVSGVRNFGDMLAAEVKAVSAAAAARGVTTGMNGGEALLKFV